MLTTINNLAMWANSYNLKSEKQHPSWINLNRFCARLSKANVQDWAYESTHLLNSLLEDRILRENPIEFDVESANTAQQIRNDPALFAVALSAAAQHMIYAALNLYTFCKTRRTQAGRTCMIGLEFRWEHWKVVFKEAKTIQNIEAGNDALAAVIAMDMAEELYNSRQTSEEEEIAIDAIPKLLEQSGNLGRLRLSKKLRQEIMRLLEW